VDAPAAPPPRVLASEEIYRGKIFSVSRDVVSERGCVYEREVVQHSGGAGVIAVFDDGTVGLVRQYRHPAARYMLELPAGKLEDGESPETCASRELEEELGVVARRVELISEFFTTPGFCSEKFWTFLATGLTETSCRHEEDELIQVVRLPFARALAMVASREIEDARTIIGLLLAARVLGYTDNAAHVQSS
jgi:ADP-ribose pyrophosphatase